jgi:hypothetical protein
MASKKSGKYISRNSNIILYLVESNCLINILIRIAGLKASVDSSFRRIY